MQYQVIFRDGDSTVIKASYVDIKAKMDVFCFYDDKGVGLAFVPYGQVKSIIQLTEAPTQGNLEHKMYVS